MMIKKVLDYIEQVRQTVSSSLKVRHKSFHMKELKPYSLEILSRVSLYHPGP